MLCLILGTAAYTVVGGLKAVMVTETLQTVVLFIGGFALLGFSLHEVGGLHTLMRDTEPPAGHPYYFKIFRPFEDADFPFTGFLTGYFVTSLWYWYGWTLPCIALPRPLQPQPTDHLFFLACFLPFSQVLRPGDHAAGDRRA